MKKIVITLCWLMVCAFGNGQNLIKNGSFEQADRIWKLTTLEGLSDWFKIRNTTPDYFVRDANPADKEKAQDGRAYIGIVFTMLDYSVGEVEYISTRLNSKLNSNKHYCLSMYVRLSNSHSFAISDLQYSFHQNKPKRLGQKGILATPIYGKLTSAKDTVLTSKKEWMYVCSSFLAKGDEEYLTIGYFNTKQKFYNITKTKKPFTITYYHIDNVSLVEINDTTTCDCSYQPKKLEPLPIQVIQHTEVGQNIVLENIYFATKSATIEGSSYASLNNLASQLKQQPSLVLEIQGYTDNVGSDADNLQLSTQRAKSVADYLVTKGVLQTQVQYHGYGSAKPIAENTTEEGRQKNRRIEIKVIQK